MEILAVLLEALLDTLILFPVLFLVHILIEVLEDIKGDKISKAYNSKLAPLFGAAVGLVPQCGFGVVATNLYSSSKIKMGTLLAVFIASSDEAIPILLSTPGAAIKLLPLLGIKFVLAVTVGFSINAIFAKRSSIALAAVTETHVEGCHHHEIGTTKTSSKWKKYLLHPVLHTLNVLMYILIVNVALGILLYFVGEDRLNEFLLSTRYFAPIFAVIIGLIPNCAASVLISSLYAAGTLGLGAAVAGLSVNCGIAIAVLFKQNKPMKDNFFIVAILTLVSLIAGYACILVSVFI